MTFNKKIFPKHIFCVLKIYILQPPIFLHPTWVELWIDSLENECNSLQMTLDKSVTSKLCPSIRIQIFSEREK